MLPSFSSGNISFYTYLFYPKRKKYSPGPKIILFPGKFPRDLFVAGTFSNPIIFL